MTTDPTPDQERELRLLHGTVPAQVLALWGLISLLPGATLRFTPDTVGVVAWRGSDSEASAEVAHRLVDRTWDLEGGLLRGLSSTTPLRSVVNRVSRETWDAVRASRRLPRWGLVSTFNPASTTETKIHDGDLKVAAADLTLISGKSYTSKAVAETWRALDVTTRDEAVERAQVETERLLTGEARSAEAKPLLRFTAAHAAPRTVSGSELTDIKPFLDLLALVGQLHLSPVQRPLRPEARGKGFAWVLNPVPLGLEEILDLNAAPPPNLPWPRLEAPITSLDGAAKASGIGTARRIPRQEGARS